MESVLLTFSKPEFEEIIRENVQAAIMDYDLQRKRNDRFAHLPEHLTKKEVAKLFEVSEGTVSNWKSEGLLPFIKLNRAVRFSREEIARIILEGSLKKYSSKQK